METISETNAVHFWGTPGIKRRGAGPRRTGLGRDGSGQMGPLESGN